MNLKGKLATHMEPLSSYNVSFSRTIRAYFVLTDAKPDHCKQRIPESWRYRITGVYEEFPKLIGKRRFITRKRKGSVAKLNNCPSPSNATYCNRLAVYCGALLTNAVLLLVRNNVSVSEVSCKHRSVSLRILST